MKKFNNQFYGSHVDRMNYEGTEKGACFWKKQIKKQPVTVLLSSFQTDRF